MAGLKGYLCALILLILIIQSVSGSISVGNIIVTPSGDLVSGQNPPKQVSVSFKVIFIPEAGVTFSDSNSLDMFTDLENAHWSYSIVLDDVANPPLTDTGKSTEINGWILSYPSRRNLAVLVNLTGEVPSVSTTGKKTLVKVGVYNGVNEVYPGSAVTREANIILPGSPAVSTTPTIQQSGGQTPWDHGCHGRRYHTGTRNNSGLPNVGHEHTGRYYYGHIPCNLVYTARTAGIP